MDQLKEVYDSSSSSYIINEVKLNVPEAKYLTKKKWFLGVRIIPLTDRDREENEQLIRERHNSASSGRERCTSKSASDESDSLAAKRELEDDPVPTKKSPRK